MSNPVILQIPVGDYQVLTYLVVCPVTKEAVIIDPAGEPDKILQQVKEGGFTVRYILNTHGHADHVAANEALTCALSVPACIHEADKDFFSLAEVKEKCALELGLPSPDPAEKGLKDGDVLEVGTLKIKVLHTPGHTPGSACFLVDGHLFTGDTLFVGAAGRTDLTGASLDTLIESIEKKILALPKETVIWPGHDYGESPSSTLEREMEENIYITDFILDT